MTIAHSMNLNGFLFKRIASRQTVISQLLQLVLQGKCFRSWSCLVLNTPARETLLSTLEVISGFSVLELVLVMQAS